MDFKFRDRAHAGRLLADKLKQRSADPDVIVLALPRGGVPIGFEVAKTLGAALDIFLVRKLGAPNQEELAIGAVASGGLVFLNRDIVDTLRLLPDKVRRITAAQQQELEKREEALRNGRERLPLRNKTIILVDDGLATGASMRAAVEAVRTEQPKCVIVAAPVASHDTFEQFKTVADEIVCVQTPRPFHSVGQWYEDFTQTTDQEVCDLLERAAQFRHSVPAH